MDRRKFVKIMGAAGVASMLPVKYDIARASAAGAPQSLGFPKQRSLQNLFNPSPVWEDAGGIQVANPMVWTRSLPIRTIIKSWPAEFTQQLHPALPKTTKIWGYQDTTQSPGYLQTHLGGLVVATRGKPVRMRVHNTLPATAIVPVDQYHSRGGSQSAPQPHRDSQSRRLSAVELRRRPL